MIERNGLERRHCLRHLLTLYDPAPQLVLAAKDRSDWRCRQAKLTCDERHQHAGGVIVQLQGAVETLRVCPNLGQDIGYEDIRITAKRVGCRLVIAYADK